MNSSETYKKLVFELQKSDITSSEIDSRILLEFVSGKSREFLLANPEFELSYDEIKKLDDLTARRKKHEPIAYIAGHKEFFGLDFLVSPDVLIPRPETELLVEEAIKFIGDRKNLKILDLGTGSGNIIISLAKNATCYFSASDISIAAIEVAKKNAAKHKAEINFIQSDLFENISGKFDLIVANLPYVPIGGSDDKEIKYEPNSAIFAGDTGAEIIKRFLLDAKKHINNNGMILAELDSRNADEIWGAANKLYNCAEIISDFSGQKRLLKILT